MLYETIEGTDCTLKPVIITEDEREIALGEYVDDSDSVIERIADVASRRLGHLNVGKVAIQKENGNPLTPFFRREGLAEKVAEKLNEKHFEGVDLV